MKNQILLLLTLLLLVPSAFPQSEASGGGVMFSFPNAPTGSCLNTQIAQRRDTGALYSCLSGSWNPLGTTATQSPNLNAAYVSTNCGAQTNCFTVKGDVQFTPFASWTNGGSTITTASGAPAFATGDVGKIIFGTSNCGSGNGNINCTLQVPQGTITGFTDAHHVTVSTTANATSSSIAWFVWGTQDDATALQSAFASLISVGGGNLYLPCNSMFVQSAPFIVTAQHFYPINIYACADGMVIPTPSFSYSSCGGAATIYGKGCIFADWYANQYIATVQSPGVVNHISDLIVWGGGVDGSSISASTQIAAIVGGNLYIENSEVVGWNWNTSNNIAKGQTFDACGFNVASSFLLNTISWSADSCGIEVQPEMISDEPTTIVGGYYGVVENGPGMDIRTGNTCNLNGCPTYTYAVTFYAALTVSSNLQNGAVLVSGQWHSNGDTSEAVTETGGTGYFEGLEENFGGNVTGFVQTGGILHAHDCDLKALNQTGGTLFNEGGNSFSSLIAASGTVIQTAAGETGSSACSSSTKSITLTGTYNSTPTITVSDETTAGGARVSAKSNTAFTVTCSGASDAFDYSVFANPT